MHILIDIRLLASGKFSGIEEYTRHLVNGMLRVSGDERYTLFYNAFKEQKADFGIEPGDRAALVRYRIPNKLFDASIRFLHFPKLDTLVSSSAASVPAPPDVIFSPHFNIAAHTPRAKRVMTIHDLSFIHHPEFFSRRKRIWHWLQNYKKQIKKADRIIAVSESTKADICAFADIDEKRVRRVYSGIDPTLVRLESDGAEVAAFRKERGLERPFFLYLAALEPRKNVTAIVRAFDLFKQRRGHADFQLVLAGSTGWLYDDILKAVRSASARRDIRLLGPVTPRERLCLYNGAFAFVYPSFFEGFGFPPLEAQRCGVPVIASNRSSLPEILGNSALLVDPWRIEDIALSLEEIVDDDGLRETLISRGFANSERFSWDRAARETLEVVREVTNE